MGRFTKLSLVVIGGFLLITVLQMGAAHAWGFWAHQRVNRLAVFTLPPEMISFYKEHLEFITEHAVDPDKRRYAVDDEAPRHYIDIDHYDEWPFDQVPHEWEDAKAKYSEDTLNAWGIVPWHIEVVLGRLTRAFEQGNTKRILQLSADLGHYVGDGHVPLHTTENYNGQLTGQKGIHGFWESRIPELYGEDYDYWTGKAEYIDEVNPHIWKFILESAKLAPEVLELERVLNNEWPSDKKYSFEQRGQGMMRVYSEEYSREYSNRMDNMVEERMRSAIIAVGSFWFTAWVDAGQPKLNDLPEVTWTEEELQDMKALDQKFQGGKIKGREHSH